MSRQRFRRYYNSCGKTLRIQNVCLGRRQGTAGERRFLAQHSIYWRLQKRNSKQTVVVGLLPREFPLSDSSLLYFHAGTAPIQFAYHDNDVDASIQSSNPWIPLSSVPFHHRTFS